MLKIYLNLKKHEQNCFDYSVIGVVLRLWKATLVPFFSVRFNIQGIVQSANSYLHHEPSIFYSLKRQHEQNPEELHLRVESSCPCALQAFNLCCWCDEYKVHSRLWLQKQNMLYMFFPSRNATH